MVSLETPSKTALVVGSSYLDTRRFYHFFSTFCIIFNFRGETNRGMKKFWIGFS